MAEETKDQKVKEQKTEEKMKDKKSVIKNVKNEAIVNGNSLSMSTKEAVAICNFIRGREIDSAIKRLEKVVEFKLAVPMKGEIPHRKGNIMSGRYPVKAVKEFIRLLKSLKANGTVNGLELEKFKLFCMSNQASRPYKRFGQGRMKRSNVVIKLIPRENPREKNKKTNEGVKK